MLLLPMEGDDAVVADDQLRRHFWLGREEKRHRCKTARSEKR
jgi:hypothetical protein